MITSMENKIKVTGALINWNGQDTLEMAIESTKHVCDEYVFVDHNSTDNSISIVKECEKKWGLNIRYYSFPRSVSQWKVRLFSFKQARGDWILVTDSDHVFYNTGDLDIKKWIEEHSKFPAIWRFPIFNLRYSLDRIVKKNAEAPPHKLFYWNVRNWEEQPFVNWYGTVGDLPKPKIPIKIFVDENYRLFNVTQQSPMKSLYRIYWHSWGRRLEVPEISLDDFIDQILEGQDKEEFAKKRFEKLRAEAPLFDEKKFGFSLPEVIKCRLKKK